jgi:hypothetical protein
MAILLRKKKFTLRQVYRLMPAIHATQEAEIGKKESVVGEEGGVVKTHLNKRARHGSKCL